MTPQQTPESPGPGPGVLRNASFLTGATRLGQFPADYGSEVAFAGRSNSGKSSAINALCSNRRLARTSKTPGRTQMINFFSLTEDLRLVDLPGYGFARVPERQRQQWKRLIEDYLTRRRCLRGVVVMMDIRHPLGDGDRMLLDWCDHQGIRVHVLLTKADKLKRGRQITALQQVQGHLGANATAQVFSSTRQIGLEQARNLIVRWLGEGPVIPLRRR